MTGPSTKILVADDSSAERNHARSALEALGFQVLEAKDGQEALEVFARERPDLVMLDVVMPRLTGLETCRILKAKSGNEYLPVIMLSTRNSVNARVEGLRSGADDYLGKPYDPEELRARVEALLRTRAILARGSEETPAHTRTRMLIAGSELPSETPRDPELVLRERVNEEFERAERYSDPLACLRVAIDGLEEIGAQKGQETVEECLLGLRALIEICVRKIDLVFRSDEGSFTVLLPNTHFPGALAVAERVCLEGRKLRAASLATGAASVSVGVSFFPNKDTSNAEDLLRFVEDALARAQTDGGGKICLFQHQGYLYAPEAE